MYHRQCMGKTAWMGNEGIWQRTVNQNSDLSEMLLWACLFCEHLSWIVSVGTSFSSPWSCLSWFSLFPILWAGESHGGRQCIVMHTVQLLRKLSCGKKGGGEQMLQCCLWQRSQRDTETSVESTHHCPLTPLTVYQLPALISVQCYVWVNYS